MNVNLIRRSIAINTPFDYTRWDRDLPGNIGAGFQLLGKLADHRGLVHTGRVTPR
ncbi:MAG TPA: hypothetical protein VF264_00355 [Rhodanobacteraceae bacterium]